MTKYSAFFCLLRSALMALMPCSAYALSYTAVVLDCAGRPAVGAVVLQEVYGVGGYAHSRGVCVRPLDSAGRFLCDKLAPGRYAIVVSVAGANAASSDALITPLMPRETLEDGPIRLSEDGPNPSKLLHVCSTAAKPISASIPEKPPASFINLAFRTPEGDLPTGVSPDYQVESGKVLMPALAPGTYHLQAYWFADGADRRYDRILRVPEDTQSELDLEQTTYSVSGAVRIEEETSTPEGMIVAANCGQFGSMVRRRQRVGSDGTFTFRRLNAPECTFSLEGAGSMSISSMQVNDQAAQYGQALLQPSPSVNRVNVIASASLASLSGRVDGKGVEGIGVVACSLGSGECHITKTAQDGTFRFAGLPVGSYRVSAWGNLDKAEYRVPAFLRQFAASNTEIQLHGTEAAEVSVNISRVF